MMHNQVRVGLTDVIGAVARALGLIAGLGLAGCAGGQSGNEGLCGEGMREDSRIPNDATFVATNNDEDGGTDDEEDAGPANQFATDDGPEAASGPNKQCPLPPDDN